ncbi:hypothetical protein VTH06DRAFT_5014 [Thermothelomyces fergusii]
MRFIDKIKQKFKPSPPKPGGSGPGEPAPRSKVHKSSHKSQSPEDVSIYTLWDLAYDKLREEGEDIIQDYEEELDEDIASIIRARVSTREKMTGLLQRKMEEVKRDEWKLHFGRTEVLVKDLVKPVQRIIDRTSNYVHGAMASNPYTATAWIGVALLLPRDPKVSGHGILLLHEEPGPRWRRDAFSWDDWDELLDDVRKQELAFDRVRKDWRDMIYDEECEKEAKRHREVMGRWDALERAQEEKKRAELLEWLCDIDPSEIYNTARNKYQEGTGNWLLEEEEFWAWEETPGSFLWLHGKAGGGKTVLASTVIKYLGDQYALNPWKALAYFCFSFSDVKKQDVSGMLASLVRQLCSRLLVLPREVKELFGYKNRGHRPSVETLETALIAVISGFSEVYIVIDALDECPAIGGARKKLLDTVRRVVGKMSGVAPTSSHILCTSRKEADISAGLVPLLSPPRGGEIDLTALAKAVEDDIGLYVDSVFASDHFKSWPNDVKAEARDLLVQKSDGMFQYVAQQLSALQDYESEPLIRKALHELPDGLDGTYERLLRDIDPKFQTQLAEVFILHPKEEVVFHEDERLFEPDKVDKYFSSLVIVYQGEVGPMGWRKSKNYVRLAHLSIKEYLTSDCITRGPARHFAFSEVDAHLDIAYASMVYHLHHNSSYETAIRDSKTAPLGQYAGRNWVQHLEMVEEWPPKVARAAARMMTMGSWSLSKMLRLFNNEKVDDDTFPFRLMQQPWETFLPLPAGTSALYLATQEGHVDIVKLLVEHGANVNPPPIPVGTIPPSVFDKPFLPPTPILQFLLERGAKPGMESDGDLSCETALELAAQHLREDRRSFRLLLEHGGYSNAQYDDALRTLCKVFAGDKGDGDPVAEIEMTLSERPSKLHVVPKRTARSW